MRGLIFATPLLLSLVSCATEQVKFENMSAMELQTYNRSVNYMDYIYCTEGVEIGSHIRRRSCRSRRDIVEGRQSPLGTPSSSASLSVETLR